MRGQCRVQCLVAQLKDISYSLCVIFLRVAISVLLTSLWLLAVLYQVLNKQVPVPVVQVPVQVPVLGKQVQVQVPVLS